MKLKKSLLSRHCTLKQGTVELMGILITIQLEQCPESFQPCINKAVAVVLHSADNTTCTDKRATNLRQIENGLQRTEIENGLQRTGK